MILSVSLIRQRLQYCPHIGRHMCYIILVCTNQILDKTLNSLNYILDIYYY